MKTKTNSNPNDQSEAEQFVDFARKIVSVPKSEIDKQQAIWERERQQRKGERELAEEN